MISVIQQAMTKVSDFLRMVLMISYQHSLLFESHLVGGGLGRGGGCYKSDNPQ